MGESLLAVRNISKTFPGVKALTDVSLSVDAGEVVALLGHNGCGKSTLVKILAGVYQADAGGEVSYPAPDAPNGGLHFIHQDLGLVTMLNTVENLDLTRKISGQSLLPSRRRKERENAEQIMREFDADLDVQAPVADLSPAERTIVAIARALDGLSGPNNVLILDEPTATLQGAEVSKLFAVVRRIAAKGTGIVFISHRLDEVMDLADRVVVLRNGRVAAENSRGEYNYDSLVDLIAGVGRTTEAPVQRGALGREVLRVADVEGNSFRHIDLTVHEGETVGISGLIGSGADKFCATVFGSALRTGGAISVDGKKLRPNRPSESIRAGIGFVPADRRHLGAVPELSARENLTLPRLRTLSNKIGSIVGRLEDNEVRSWMNQVEVYPAHPERPFKLFSGGNQQKIVIAKWLRTRPRLLLLDEPTQGVDVGAIASIYQLIRTAARNGTGVVVASSDAKELAEVCDRVLVFREGEIAVELKGQELTESAIVRAALAENSASGQTF